MFHLQWRKFTLSMAAMLAPLLLVSCSITVTGNPFGDLEEIDPANFRINRREVAKQVAEIKRAAELSFRGQICSAAGRDDDDAADLITPLVQTASTPFTKYLMRGRFHAFFSASDMQNTGLGIVPMTKRHEKAVTAAVVEVYPGLQPNADASFRPEDGARIRLSLGLVRALCRETGLEEGIEQLDRAVNAPDPSDAGDAWISALGDVTAGIAFAQMSIQLAEQNFKNAMFFTIGHELAHVTLDPNSNANVTSENAEIRADLYGLLAIEAMTGKHSMEAAANRHLRRTLSFSETDPARIVTLVSTDGHITTFDLVYQKAGLKETGGVHLPFDQRIRLLDTIASRFGRRSGED